MLSVIAIILSTISIILMTIILIRFYQLFSTDDIINNAKTKMNSIMKTINKETKDDLELINASTLRMKALLNEADRKMEKFNEATQRLRDMIGEADKVSKKNSKSFLYNDKIENEGLANIKPVGYSENHHKKQTFIDPDASFETTQNLKSQSMQGSLFDDAPSENSHSAKTILKDETKVTPEGAAYKEVPLIITKVYDDKQSSGETLTKSQKSAQINEKVEKLFRQGMSADDIASELSCSISEVQLIIDLL